MGVASSGPADSRPAEATIPVGEALRRTAVELADLGRNGERLQEVLTPLLQLADVRALRDLQALDELVQRLWALESFIAALGAECHADWPVRPGMAARAVTLADVAERLSGSAARNDPRPDGDLELF